MGLDGSTVTFGTRAMPLLAILRHDLRTLKESWLVRIWVAASALLTLLLAASCWHHDQTAALVARMLALYLVFPWFLVVMVLGVNPVSGSRIDALADGFLSRPVTRYEFLLGVWASRVAVVLGVYLVVMVPAVLVVTLANRPVPVDNVTVYGTLAALSVVALVLTLQVSLGFLLGIVLRRPLVAIVLLLFLWYPVNMVLDTFNLEAFSTISLSKAMPTRLRQPWRQANPEAQAAAESPDAGAGEEDLGEMFVSILTGRTPQKASKQAESLPRVRPRKPPPRPIEFGPDGKPIERPEWRPGFFEYDYDLLPLASVAAGYGVPTLLAVGLATLCFCWRDL